MAYTALLKHMPGKHDQETHGRNGGEFETRFNAFNIKDFPSDYVVRVENKQDVASAMKAAGWEVSNKTYKSGNMSKTYVTKSGSKVLISHNSTALTLMTKANDLAPLMERTFITPNIPRRAAVMAYLTNGVLPESYDRSVFGHTFGSD